MNKKLKMGLISILNLMVFYVLFMGIAGSSSWHYHDDYLDGLAPDARLYFKASDWETSTSSDYTITTSDQYGAGSTSLQISYDEKENSWYIKRGKKAHPLSTNVVPHSDLTFYVDAVNNQGYSTWDQPKYVAELKETKEGKDYIQFKTALEFSAPPEHRMLVVESLSDMENYSKKWLVDKVEATNSAGEYRNVTNDEDFEHYSDNSYTFFKATKFTIDAGKKLSGEEQDLFGEETSEVETSKQYTGTYSIVESDGVKKLKISVANSIHKDFTLLNSSYSTMTLAYDVEKENPNYTQNVRIYVRPAKAE